MENQENLMTEIISLCRRRGFVFQSSEIYGGLQGVYDYGPLGVELRNNLKKSWWSEMVYNRDDVEGIDSSILTHKLSLYYSGHQDTFCDPMIDCRKCKTRMRADFVENGKCINCGSTDLTDSRNFNLMFKTNFGPVEDLESFVYLRPETAQGIFTNFKNVLDTTSRKLPFGIAQIGKSFRNEITTKNFIFRTREFEQMELEFFVKPGEDEQWHNFWVQQRLNWWISQGLSRENLKLYNQPKEDLSHYSKATVDILYRYPIGFQELEGIANRMDFDLGSHSKEQGNLNLQAKTLFNKDSNTRMSVDYDQEQYIPFVIEPSAGVDRGVFAILSEAYCKEDLENGTTRIVLKLKPDLSPYKVAVAPLAKNNCEIVQKSKEVTNLLRTLKIGRIKYEDTGNIGKAYRRHDEVGTPLCVTVDFQTLEDNDQTVTVRDRDSMKQTRVSIQDLKSYVREFYGV